MDTDPTTDSGDVWGFAPMNYAAGDLNIPLKTGTKGLSSLSSSSSVSSSPEKDITRDFNKRIEKRKITIHQEQKHSGELWYVFQSVDSMIDMLEKSLKGTESNYCIGYCILIIYLYINCSLFI